MAHRYQIAEGKIILASQAFIDARYPGAVLLPDLPVRVHELSIMDFRSRFTDGEKIAIYTAADAAIAIKVWLDDLQSSEYVSLDDPRTVGGVYAMEFGGLIGPGRAAEILA